MMKTPVDFSVQLDELLQWFGAISRSAVVENATQVTQGQPRLCKCSELPECKLCVQSEHVHQLRVLPASVPQPQSLGNGRVRMKNDQGPKTGLHQVSEQTVVTGDHRLLRLLREAGGEEVSPGQWHFEMGHASTLEVFKVEPGGRRPGAAAVEDAIGSFTRAVLLHQRTSQKHEVLLLHPAAPTLLWTEHAETQQPQQLLHGDVMVMD